MILLRLARKVTDTFKKFALARLQCEAREYMMNMVGYGGAKRHRQVLYQASNPSPYEIAARLPH